MDHRHHRNIVTIMGVLNRDKALMVDMVGGLGGSEDGLGDNDAHALRGDGILYYIASYITFRLIMVSSATTTTEALAIMTGRPWSAP